MAGPLGGIDGAIQDRHDRRARLAIVAIVLAALALRVARLGHESFWIDELNAVHLARSGGVLHAVRSFGPFEPPLSHLLVAVSLKLPFGAETAARLPMALFGAVEVLALYLLARELTKRISIALLAAGLLAVAPFSVRYSQEARYYTMFSALQLLSWWMLLRALRGEEARVGLVRGARRSHAADPSVRRVRHRRPGARPARRRPGGAAIARVDGQR